MFAPFVGPNKAGTAAAPAAIRQPAQGLIREPRRDFGPGGRR